MTGFEVQDTPDIRGLEFRGYRGKEDLPLLHHVATKESLHNEDEFPETLEDFTAYYNNLVNCDPFKHILIAEVDGKVVNPRKYILSASIN